jgi:PAS domain S-box-containing protein
MSERPERQTMLALRTVFLIMALVLVVSVLVTFQMGLLVIRGNEQIIERHIVIDELGDVLSTVKDAETGQRGYLLTGDEQYLEPFNDAKTRIHKEVDDVVKLAQVYDISTGDLTQYRSLVDSKLSELDNTITLHQSGKHEEAVQVVRTNLGKQIMDQIRDLSARMIDREEKGLNVLNDRARRLTFIRSEVFALVALVDLAFIYWAYRRIRRESLRRHAAAMELWKQMELQRVTLASIGDGVIVTDAAARITFLNEVAAQLTGWPAPEALGQSCTKVFNIISEESRQRAESPVDKVLREGVIVGLANHTLLIRKNGSEIPIDDSGAPIRDADGTVRGVVLVFRDFTEHKQAEQELRRAKGDAEAANVAKDNFLATLSHELRTPLTPVVAALSEWETNPTLPNILLSDVQMMRRNVELEARLIDDLLDLTRIVRGKLSLSPEVADVHKLVTSVTQMYQSDIRGKRLQLTMHLDAAKHFVYADPGRLQQVFWNILKNATKFTSEGGRIDLTTRNDRDGKVFIDFHDSGIGMNADTLTKIFRPFEQGDDETVKRYGGLGLGMTISRALMEAQGGDISAQSDGLGLGSTFVVAIPYVNEPECQPTPAPAPRPAPAKKSLRILLVEDHADTADIMSRLLRHLGHSVALADSVHEAMSLVNSSEFDLLMSDIGLPDGTGIDLIKQIRKTRDIPAIALTGFGMEDDIAACKAAGFNEHLTKPVSFQKLEMAVTQLANRPA